MRRIISLVLMSVLVMSTILAFGVSSASYDTYKVGDLNGDDNIDARDSNCLRRYFSGTYILKDERCADINSDGQVVLSDAAYLLKALNGLYNIVQPPKEQLVAIDAYTVVYPENATVYEVYATEILCDWVFDNCGVVLNAVDDSGAESDYEILIGNTNRAESTIDLELENNQYLLKTSGNKLVLHGKDYMIGGAVGELTYNKMSNSGVRISEISNKNIICDYSPVEGDNIILMIGDGMGFNQVAFTQFYLRRDPTYSGFVAENFPNSGECVTYCLSEPTYDYSFNKITTDSAAAATALSTGWKTQKGYLGVNAYEGNVVNIREIAFDLGYKTAVVSTEGSTGATPAGFTVHTNSRANAEDILAQQAELVENGEITYLKGDSYDNLLADTKTALDLVSTDSDGFFVMIEEAYIDKACHKLASDYSIGDLAGYVRRFNTAIQYAATFTASCPGTVLIVTADHETGSVTATGGYDVTGNHSNVNVPVYAMGYGCEYFNNNAVDNTDIADFMAKIYGLDSFGGEYYNVKE